MAKIELGETGRDTITGFEGIATGRAEYITGCTQVLLQPTMTRDGAFVESRWMDEDRLEKLKAKRIQIGFSAPGPDKPAPRR